jgi:hypothetical protein
MTRGDKPADNAVPVGDHSWWNPDTGGGYESDAVMAERLEMTRWELANLYPVSD